MTSITYNGQKLNIDRLNLHENSNTCISAEELLSQNGLEITNDNINNVAKQLVTYIITIKNFSQYIGPSNQLNQYTQSSTNCGIGTMRNM